VGCGFATVENVMYVFGHGYEVGILRMLTAVPGHAFDGVILGYFMGKAKFSARPEKFLIRGLLIVIILHGTYNTIAFSDISWSFYPVFAIVVFGIYLALKAKKELERRITKNYQLIKILEYSEDCDYADTFDLEVECYTHSFIANNTIVHNSLCETRIRTGIGIPQVTALMEVVKIAQRAGIPVIADGAIRTPGDAAKALALGADTVMCGSLLAGTKESPGHTIQIGNFPNEKLYKSYRGSASSASKLSRGENGHIEGNSKMIPYKGKVKRITCALIDGIRSSMSYVNALTIKEFQRKAKFVKVTPNGVREAHPHLM